MASEHFLNTCWMQYLFQALQRMQRGKTTSFQLQFCSWASYPNSRHD